MTPEQIKASILQYAIQGKLVEQRPEEGTAEELYQQIQEEKQRLIKEKKIKKENPLAEITEDEIPFDIPDGWKWVRLGQCGCFERGNGIKKGETSAEGFPCVRYGQLYTTYETRFSKAISHVPQEIFNSCKKAYKSDILMALTGENEYDIALAVTYEGEEELAIGGDMTRFFNHCMNPLYLIYVINSRYGILCKSKLATGNIIVHISNDKLATIPIPLPPLAEQHRIVAKIEELLPYVDRYAKAYEKLEKLNAKFPEDMKKSILQYAIQGKLVEQREEEGTAEELYQQIQEEKQRLIKEGKIKKEKPLAEITEDEIPFDIPENWKWVYVGDLFSHNTGKAMNSSVKRIDKPGSVRKFITTSNVYWNTLDFTNVKEMFFSDDELDRCTISKGDMLMCEGGAYYGRTAIWNYEYDICFQNHVHRLRRFKDIDLLFFYYVFYLYRNTGMMVSKGTAMPGLSSIALHQMIIPLPPLAEQHRIVAKIEELLPYCDRLAELK